MGAERMEEIPNWVWVAGLIALVVLANLWSEGASDDDDDSPSRTPTPVIYEPAYRPALNPTPVMPAYRPVGDLDCADIGHQVYVGANDPNYLDADNDGVGCEGW